MVVCRAAQEAITRHTMCVCVCLLFTTICDRVCLCVLTVYHAFVSDCVLQDVDIVLKKLNAIDKVDVTSIVTSMCLSQVVYVCFYVLYSVHQPSHTPGIRISVCDVLYLQLFSVDGQLDRELIS